MKCLCCNKEIINPSEKETVSVWHKKCVRNFFGTEDLPEIGINKEDIEELADRTVNKGVTVPGVQKKISLHLDTEGKESRLTLVDYPSGYILKPESPDYPCLPEAEFLTMKMAEISGISVVPNALIRLKDSIAYITKRVDRDGKTRYAMEDFCQLAGRITADKYKGSYEKCGRIIFKYSKNQGIDIAELFCRLIFCYITGNSDMHYKNFSLLEKTSGGRVFGLSPAYDLLPVNIIIPEDDEETALTLNGKKRNVRKKDFLIFAGNLGISEKNAAAFINRIIRKKEDFITAIHESYMNDKMKLDMTKLLEQRIERLQ